MCLAGVCGAHPPQAPRVRPRKYRAVYAWVDVEGNARSGLHTDSPGIFFLSGEELDFV